MSNSPLSLYRAEVLPEWLDVNDHMNVAYYALVFDQASGRFMEHLGVDNDYIQERHFSWVALESHTTFGRELRARELITSGFGASRRPSGKARKGAHSRSM